MTRELLKAAGLAAVLGLAAPAAAQTPPEGLVWLALRDINSGRVDEADPTNHPPLATEPPDGMIVAVDLSPDGRPDWLVDYGAAGDARYCGTGGCRLRLYASHGDAYVRAFDAMVLHHAVAAVDGERQLAVQVHSLYCEVEQTECRYTYGWDDAAGRLALRSGPREPAEADQRFSPLGLVRE